MFSDDYAQDTYPTLVDTDGDWDNNSAFAADFLRGTAGDGTEPSFRGSPYQRLFFFSPYAPIGE